MIDDFQLPNYSSTSVYETAAGNVSVLKADFGNIDRIVAEWEAENPQPTPPTIPVTPDGDNLTLTMARAARQIKKATGITIEQAESRVAAEQPVAADGTDEGYLTERSSWAWARYEAIERELLLNYTLYDMGEHGLMTLAHLVHEDVGGDMTALYLLSPTLDTLREIMSGDGRLGLYNYIVSISKLTWDAVLDEADKLGVIWRKKTVLRQIPQGSGDQQDIVGIAKITAIDMGITPTNFDAMSIKNQAELLAVALTRQWLERFQTEQSRAESKGVA